MEWCRSGVDRGWGGVQWDRGVDGRGRGMERVEGKRIGVGGNPKCRVVGYVGGGEQGRLARVERGEWGQTWGVVENRGRCGFPQGGEETRVEGNGRLRRVIRAWGGWVGSMGKTGKANVSRTARG